MPHILIKSSERRKAEARTLREFGIDPRCATREQREYAECVTAGNQAAEKELKRMEEKS